MTVYEASGLTLSSDIPLALAELPAPPQGKVDVAVVLGPEIDQPFERPSPDLVAELVMSGFLCYTICEVNGGYVIRLPWIADFVVDAGGTHVTCLPAVGGRPELIPIVLPGTVTAFLLSLRGICVLHGSAVTLGERAITFVGVSGQGKSTMAALFCANGAQLLTDDVLPIGFEEGPDGPRVFCVRSGSEIRLREKAESIALRFSSDSVRRSNDGRFAVTAERSSQHRVPLAAIVLPRPDHERQAVVATRLSPGEAQLALGRYERIEGWQSPEHFRRQFEHASRIVEAVPVFVVSVPWGPEFDDELPQQVLAACGLGDLALAG